MTHVSRAEEVSELVFTRRDVLGTSYLVILLGIDSEQTLNLMTNINQIFQNTVPNTYKSGCMFYVVHYYLIPVLNSDK